jgi:uncharacterized protein with GYD domain
MDTFVVLAKWTEKTFASLKDAAAAAEEIKKAVKSMGAEIKAWYMLMGQYDEICILEAPNPETIAKIVISLSAQYGVKTETMQAFNEAESLKIISSLG